MQSPAAFIRGVRHPEAYHGQGKTNGFFEGWYIKLVSQDANQRWAVIPGIFRGLKAEATSTENESTDGLQGRDLAFVQVLDGQTGRSWFHEFDVAEFSAKTDQFSVRVAGNRFDSNGVTLDLPQLKGSLEYSSPIDPWPVTLTSPGIMGWFGMVPFMECFHGVVSFGHSLSGALLVEGSSTEFTGGRGYIEKDWGRAFPSGYVWMQSNHFASDQTASLVASVAIIPWLTGAFRGFIIGLKHGGNLYRWATYNRTKESSLAIDDSHVRWSLTGPDGRLEITAERVAGGLLHAPLRTSMYRRVEETMLANVQIRHTDTFGKTLFQDTGTAASMEVFGDLDRLLAI